MSCLQKNRAESIRRFLWLCGALAFGLALAPRGFSDPLPTCGVASLSTYDAADYQCTLGDYTLDDFTFSASGTASLLSDAQITVDPTGSTPTTISFQFSTPGGFTAGDGQTAEYVVQYNMDPLLPMIPGGIVDLGPNDPVTLTGEFCGNGALFSAPNTNPAVSPTCLGNNPSGIFPAKTQLMGTGGSASAGFSFPMLVSTVDSRLILDINGPGETDSFGAVMNVTGGGPTATPEPSTSFLLVPAMFGLAWLRKRSRSARP
jgi:hypothetical protein